MKILTKSLRLAFAVLAALVCSYSVSAQISRDGSVSASATSGTFSATATGDVKIVFAFRNGTATAPSLPGTYTSIATGTTAAGGTVAAFRIGCEKSTSSADTGTGTWTNATAVVGMSYAGTNVGTTANCNTTAVGNVATSNAKTSASASYTGITIGNTAGNSWVLGFLGGTGSSTCTPTGMTSVSAIGTIRGSDTNAHVASWSTTTCAVTSETWMSYVLELISLPANPAPSVTLTTTPSVAAVRNVVVAMSETVSESDSCIACKNAQNLFEGYVTVDGVATLRNGNAAITETLSESDSVTQFVPFSRSMSETVSASDSIVTVRAMHETLAETLSESDSVTGLKTGTHVGNMTETLSESDSAATVRALNAALTESLTPTDSISSGKNGNRNISMTETLTLVDSVRAPGNHPDLFETLSESDSVVCSHCNPAQITEGYITVDTLAIKKSQPAIIETLTTIDSLSGVRGGISSANISETLTTTATCGTSHCNPVPIVDGHVTIDAVTAIRASANGAMSESLTTTDSLSVIQCITMPGENLTTVDLVSAAPSHVATINDQLFSINDIASVQAARLRLLSETLTTNPSISVSTQHTRSLAEILTASASIATTSAHVGNMAETVGEFDSVLASTAAQQSATMSESLAVSVSISASGAHIANLFETVTESDSLSVGRFNVANPIESLTTSDVLAWEPGRLITINLLESDSVAALKQAGIVLAESHPTVDSIFSTTRPQYFANFVESLTTHDAISFTVQPSLKLTETLTTVDSLFVTKNGGQIIINVVEFLREKDFVIARPPLRRKRFMVVDTP